MSQAFPRQTNNPHDIVIPDTAADVSAKAVRDSLFAQSGKEAPGPDGINFKALRLLWRWAEERFVSLARGCIRLGHHPRTWKTAKGILLRKQGEPTYTIAKAYRVTSLLSCLGKVVEKVVATWIASCCERNDSLPPRTIWVPSGKKYLRCDLPAGISGRRCLGGEENGARSPARR